MMITVRKATPADADHMVLFNRSLATETEQTDLPDATVRDGVAAVFDDPDKGFYLVAETDGAVAGGLLITTEWSDWRNAYFWWIQSVYVLPEYRKQGVYRSLHRAVEQLARESRDVCGIRLYVDRNNERARRTYEQLGMKMARYDLFETNF